jgi:predicted phosphoribosyltransferase
MKTFKDRKEAGILLGKKLKKYNKARPVVLAIPRGGVVTGFYVAIQLGCDLQVILSRKMGYRSRPETAFGAVAEDGTLYLNPWYTYKLSREDILEVKKREMKQIERSIKLYRNGKSLPTLQGKVVILVDDGIATGATLFACIEMCKKLNAEKIVVAVPVAERDMPGKLIKKVDDVVILTMPEPFYAVSQVYEKFESVGDDEVLRFLDKNKAIQNFSNTLAMII